jgi:hypothetical protein
MSSINIFMDKKIKKYSWIHELNAAAMKAKLLNEAQKYSNQQKFLAEEQQRDLLISCKRLVFPFLKPEEMQQHSVVGVA